VEYSQATADDRFQPGETPPRGDLEAFLVRPLGLVHSATGVRKGAAVLAVDHAEFVGEALLGQKPLEVPLGRLEFAGAQLGEEQHMVRVLHYGWVGAHDG